MRIDGTLQNDLLIGTGENDIISGGGGNDTLVGGAGDDILVGGTGFNYACYNGAISDYTITAYADHYTVTGPEGTDTLYQIQALIFQYGTVYARTRSIGFGPLPVSISPANHSGDVSLDAEIVISYSAPIVANEGYIHVAWNDTLMDVSITDATQVTISGNTLSLHLAGGLAYNTGYMISFSGTIVEAANGPMDESSYAYYFTTVGPVDTTPPVIVSSLPEDDQGDYPTSRVISLTFSESVKRGSGNIALYKYDGTLVESFDTATSSQLSFGGTYLEIDLSHYLRPDTSYYVLVSSGAVVDGAGNAFAGIASPNVLNFHTHADPLDTTAPVLQSVWPDPGKVNVDTDTFFGLSFDELVELGSGTFSIYRASDNSLYTTISAEDATQVSANGQGIRLTPSQGWEANTQYYVLVSPGAITDKQGNAFAGISSPSLTTFTTSPTIKIKSGSYTIAADFVVNLSVDFDSIYVAYQVTSSITDTGNGLINYGRVSITDTGAEQATGIGPGDFTAHNIHFDNNAGAVFSLTATSAVGADVNNFKNDGVLTVAGQTRAQAVATGNFRNTGTITVTAAAGQAFGVTPTNPSSPSNYPFEVFDNSGTIHVTGNSDWVCYGVTLDQGNADLSNAGSVIVTNNGSGGTVGFTLPAVHAPATFTNTGMIRADVAIIGGATAYSNIANVFTIANSGRIDGDIWLDSVYDAYGKISNVVRNTGQINGDIWFGIGDDTFDGRGGTTYGVVYGGGGDDNLIGGAGADWFCDYQGNDTIDGGGGYNTLILLGTAADYTITTSGSVTTIDGMFCHQTVTNIQLIQFAGPSPSLGTVDMYVRDLVIGAGQSITFTADMADAGGSAITVTPTAARYESGLSIDNHGSIIASTANHASGVVGVTFNQSGMYLDCHFVNDGLFQITADTGMASGTFWYASTPQFTNTTHGSVIVTGELGAVGLTLNAVNQTLTNDGLIQVSAHRADRYAQALGCRLSGSGWTVANSGTLDVVGVSEATTAVFFQYGDCTVINSGTISATGIGPKSQAFAITNAKVVTNTGTITGDIALTDTSPSTVVNSGTITGVITNAALYDGSLGRISGRVCGTAGDDIFTGGTGGETFQGNGGNDIVDGGAGLDIAVFSGNRATYTITHNANGTTTISGADGSDTLSQIERAQFADQTVTIATVAANDFVGSGRSAILWQNDNGTAAVWIFDGFEQIGGSPVGGNPGPSWHVVGSGDFFGDGTADVLWQNDEGSTVIWTMDGLEQTGSAWVGVNPGADWHVKGVADFNGDGKDDIVWQNDNGQAAIWKMNGFTVLGGSYVGGNPGSDWHIVGTGDFNTDGCADIVWQNDNGLAAIWTMDGFNQTGSYFVGGNPGPSWHIKGVGDFYGTGQSDILWQGDDGRAVIWTMEGVTQVRSDFIGGNPGTDWHIVGTGDYNGDGCSDIVWQNDNGQAALWTMSGSTQLGGSLVGGNPGSDWHIPAGVG